MTKTGELLLFVIAFTLVVTFLPFWLACTMMLAVILMQPEDERWYPWKSPWKRS